LASTDHNNVHCSTLVNRAHLHQVCHYFASFPETKAKMENAREEAKCLRECPLIIGMEKTNGYILYMRMLIICFRLCRCTTADVAASQVTFHI